MVFQNSTRLTLDTGLIHALTLPPLCTSISGVLRAEILVLSSQAEWLQTGRAGPICWSSLLCRTSVLFLLFDINNRLLFDSAQFCQMRALLEMIKMGNMNTRGGVDTKSCHLYNRIPLWSTWCWRYVSMVMFEAKICFCIGLCYCVYFHPIRVARL